MCFKKGRSVLKTWEEKKSGKVMTQIWKSDEHRFQKQIYNK